jgi:hypothetical protein
MAEQYVVEIHSEEDWRRVADILERAGYLWASGNPIQRVCPYIPGKIYLLCNKTIQKSGSSAYDVYYTKVSSNRLSSVLGLRWTQEDI